MTHTDLKPENMLIGSGNQIMLCDFGMGQRGPSGVQWTVVGELSTLWYRAPELLLGCKVFDEKIDEWAIGCTIMEILTGTTMFKGEVGQNFLSQCPGATHRNFNSDQLQRILKVAGTPKVLSGFECAKLIKGWPVYERHIEPVVNTFAYFSFLLLNVLYLL